MAFDAPLNAPFYAARRRPLVALAALVVALLLAPAAAAEPSAADKETARALMELGHTAYDGGQYSDALQPFEQAHAIMQLPTTGLWLARTNEKLGYLVQARDVALSVARLPAPSNEVEARVKARKDAASLAAALAPRIPSLELRVAGPAPDAVTVLVDGKALTGPVVGLPRKLDPGHHQVQVRAPGFRQGQIEVDLAEGEGKVAELRLQSEVFDRTNVPSPTQAETGPSSLVYVGFGLAAAGAVAGSITGVMALSQASDAKATCSNNLCPRSSQEAIDSANTLADISTVSFAVGLAGLALGVVVLATSDDAPDTTPKLEAELGLGTACIRGSF